MNINLSNLSNESLIRHIESRISQYEQERELENKIAAPIYAGVSLSEFQQYEKNLQRCLQAGSPGAFEIQAKVKSILKANGIDDSRDYQSKTINMFEVYQQMNRRI